MDAIRTLFGLASVASTYAAALLGALVAMTVGPALAMGAQMYTGNTEPRTPHLPWPAATMFVLLMLPVPFLYRRAWGLASVAAIPVALLPFYQLYRLYLAAGAP